MQGAAVNVTVVPCIHQARTRRSRLKYDGVMLSNGPGDPAENVEIVANLKELLKSDMPIFGICLGHQLLALAIDAKTTKLKYGHRGVNHPVKDIDADRTYITSQNHGYAVVRRVGRSEDRPRALRQPATTAPLRASSTSAVRYSPFSTTRRYAPARWIPRICLISSSKILKSRKEALSNAAAQGYS